MDAVLIPYKREQSFAPNKHIGIKTPKKNRRGNFISNPSENLDKYAGLLNHPPPPRPPPPRAMSFSYPLSSSALVFSHQYQQNQQPPLLPLPNVSAIHQQPRRSRSLSSQGLSLPPSSKKNKTRDMSLTPKKSKPIKREEVKERTTQTISEFLIVASDNRWGPDPNDLPKHLPVVLTSSSTSKVLTGKGFGTVSVENMDMFPGSIFNLSPPPSSLPLPNFSLRSKLSCNAEAAGVDTGATNNLRRLLRLR